LVSIRNPYMLIRFIAPEKTGSFARSTASVYLDRLWEDHQLKKRSSVNANCKPVRMNLIEYQ